MKETFDKLRAQMRDDKKDTGDEMMVSAGLDLLQQLLTDVHRAADASVRQAEALERIAGHLDGKITFPIRFDR